MNELMHEVMIDVFIDLEGENLEGKTPKEVLLKWVQWIDARYKVAMIPDVCYAIIDCEDGNVVSMINAEIPNAKQTANEMCAMMNNDENDIDQEVSLTEQGEKMVDVKDVADAFLNMDEDSFMDFLMNRMPEEKEE